MHNFEVIINCRARMIVRAVDAQQASDIAIRGTMLRYPEGYSFEAGAGLAPLHVQADIDKGLVKSESIGCTHCGTLAHRSEWGPGWVTCPNCKKHPPTPAELADIRYEGAIPSLEDLTYR